MSKTLVCLKETVPFYIQDVCKENPLDFNNFVNCSPSKCLKLEKDGVAFMDSFQQAENTCMGCAKTDKELQFQAKNSRKREAGNILVESVKRRDNLRNISLSSAVPSESFLSDGCSDKSLQSTFLSVESSNSADISDSSIIDSEIDTSKIISPTHCSKLTRPSSIEESINNDLLDNEEPKTIIPEVFVESEDNPKCLTSSAVSDFSDLHLSDEPDNSASPKSPVIQSLFKSFPSMIYFSTVDEPVTPLPEETIRLLKWKLSTITPAVLKDIVLKTGYSLVDVETTEYWTGTWGKHLKFPAFKQLKCFQKVNHYPGAFHLGRKDRFWKNYNKMLNRHGEEIFNFFPDTFILPADLKVLKTVWKSQSNNCWIVKPCASARGTGVKVIHKWSQVPKNKPFVVQRYISNPYLIDGSKFDLRLYVLVSSVEPLRVYVFEDGLVRFASEKYSMTNKSFSNRFIHLTNYSINKKSSTYTSNEDENMCQGHKWSLKSFWTYMTNSGIDVSSIKEKIVDMIVKTILCAEGPIRRLAKIHAKSSYNCFELFGFDIMLDEDLRPWLLEVNISPSMHTKSMLDCNVKGPLVKDMLNIAGFEVPEEKLLTDVCDPSLIRNRHRPLHCRWLSQEEKKKHAVYTYQHAVNTYQQAETRSDILDRLTVDDLHCLMESEDELQRCGNFTRVFPTHTTHKYFKLFDHIRYYNVLLDAWEKTFHDDRDKGIKILQELSEKPLNSTPALKELEMEADLTITGNTPLVTEIPATS